MATIFLSPPCLLQLLLCFCFLVFIFGLDILTKLISSDATVNKDYYYLDEALWIFFSIFSCALYVTLDIRLYLIIKNEQWFSSLKHSKVYFTLKRSTYVNLRSP